MPVQLASIAQLLMPGLRGVTGEYSRIPVQYKEMFAFAKSDLAVERTVQARFLSYAQLKTEGGNTTFDNNAGQRFIYNQEHVEVGLGYGITRKAIDDNLYKTQFRPSNLGLMNSFKETKEVYAANVFNTANVYQAAVGGDGVALLSTAHPVDGNTFSNTPTVQADLNEASLLSLMIQIRRSFIDQAGLKIYARARKLVVPPELEPVARRLLMSDLRPGSGDNDINVIRSTSGGLPNGFFVYDYLTSPYTWYLLTDQPGLLWLERIPFETDMQVDFNTDNLLVKGYERFSFSYFDPRAIAGSMPTS